MRERPFGVTVLAILAGIAAVLVGVRVLQSLALLPYFFGPIPFRGFNLWAALMWGLLLWVYIWLVQMLWRVDPQAWLFLAVITVFNLILDFMTLIGGAVWQDVSASFIINAIILLYIMLPGTKRAFGTD